VAYRKYLVKVRWPEGFRCPHCQAERGWRTGRRLWRCRQCRRSVSVTANTLFEKTPIPLTVWFRAAWELSGKGRTPTIAEFRKALGLGSYKTTGNALGKENGTLMNANSRMAAVHRVGRLIREAIQGKPSREIIPLAPPPDTPGQSVEN
jgi:ribosomal protein L37AE/L43A